MSFLDKIVNSVRLNDGYDDQEDFVDDESVEEEEEEPRSGFFTRWSEKRQQKKEKKRFQKAAGSYEEAEDYPDDEAPTFSLEPDRDDPEDDPVRDNSPKRKYRWSRNERDSRERAAEKRSEETEDDYEESESLYDRSYERSPRPRVTPLRSRKRGQAPVEVKVIRPTSMEDSKLIADTLMSDRMLLLNLEGIDMDVAQRIIDFSCGTCYSLRGRLQKISNYIFMLTPEEVDTSGDVTSMLDGDFAIPTMRSEY